MQNISHRICLFVVVVVIVVVGGWWGAMVLVVPPKVQGTASVTGGSVTLWIVAQCFTPGRGLPTLFCPSVQWREDRHSPSSPFPSGVTRLFSRAHSHTAEAQLPSNMTELGSFLENFSLSLVQNLPQKAEIKKPRRNF